MAKNLVTISDITLRTADTDSMRDAVTAIPESPTEWTNEKHSLFVGSLEASFVKKLNHSIALRACYSQSPLNPSPRNSSSSDQFVVVQNGYQKTINFKRETLGNLVNSRKYKKHLPNFHFQSPINCHATGCSDLREIRLGHNEGTRIRGQLPESERSSAVHSECDLSNEDEAGSITEFSDQNFVDEVKGQTSSHASMGKRRKLNANAGEASSNDQVVPFRNFDKADG